MNKIRNWVQYLSKNYDHTHEPVCAAQHEILITYTVVVIKSISYFNVYNKLTVFLKISWADDDDVILFTG